MDSESERGIGMKKMYGWTITLVLLSFAAVGIFLSVAPDQIPVHYNIQGEIDRWGSKYEYVSMPFCSLISGAFLALIARWEGKKGRVMNEKVVGILNIWVLILFNILWIVFMWRAVASGTPGNPGGLPGKVIMMLMSAAFIPLGNVLPKAERNSAFGLRTKWSMANDQCWQQSQRVGGFVMVGTGILGVILSALLPELWAGYAMIGLITVMTIGCIYASYRIYKKNMA